MNIAETIQRFEHDHSEESFPHAKEVLALLRNYPRGLKNLEVGSGRLNDEVRSTYRLRAEIAAKLQSTRSPSLAEDTAALSRSFDQARDQPLRHWLLLRENGRLYVVFELLDEGRVAGCLDTRDAREPQDPE